MNYYERHLGDYARDTAHLSMLEHGAYSILLDRYYATEAGIPDDQVHRIARARTKEERQAVGAVLDEFFELVDGVWINHRAEEEIAKAKTRIKAAQENGKRGGRPKANRNITKEKPSGLLPGSENETQSKAHHTPYTKHQAPDKTNGDQAASTDLDPAAAPPADVVDARALELSVLLRQRGAGVTAGNPHVRRWARSGVTDAQALLALETAERRRAETGSMQPVNAGLLNAIIDDQQRAPPAGRKTIHDDRAATIAALTGRSRSHDHEPGTIIDVTPAGVAGGVD